MNTAISNIKSRINNSKLIKGFVATVLGSTSSKIILVIATFISSNCLGKMEFGEFSFVRNTLNMILCICALNFSALCTKFTIEAKESLTSLHRLFLLFLFSFAICCIIGLTLIFTPQQILIKLLSTETVVFFFKIIGLFLPFIMLQPLIEGILRGLQRFKIISILQIVSSCFYLIAIYIGIKIGKLNGALIGIILYYLLYSVICCIFLFKKSSIKDYYIKLRGFTKELHIIYTMILPLFLMSFIDAPIMWIAQVLLSKYGTMEAIGSMTAIMQIRNLAMLIPSYFSNTYIAFAGELNSQKKYDEYYIQYKKITKIYLFIGIGMFLVFSILSQPILFLYGKDFITDWPVMIISNIAIPITMLIGILRIDLLLKEHQQYLLYTSIIWNTIWIATMYFMISLDIDPLYSFFISQNIGAIVFILALYIKYSKERKTFYKIKKGS